MDQTSSTIPPGATIAIASDHAGVGLKAAFVDALREQGFAPRDLGPATTDSVDYPDYAHAVCREVTAGRAAAGVLICGSGIGMSIAANRHPDIRCALLHDVTGARLTRLHNNANVLAIGARMTGAEVALDILRTFLATPYEGGRHQKRLDKLTPPA